jgi:hypothetical protein
VAALVLAQHLRDGQLRRSDQADEVDPDQGLLVLGGVDGERLGDEDPGVVHECVSTRPNSRTAVSITLWAMAGCGRRVTAEAGARSDGRRATWIPATRCRLVGMVLGMNDR